MKFSLSLSIYYIYIYIYREREREYDIHKHMMISHSCIVLNPMNPPIGVGRRVFQTFCEHLVKGVSSRAPAAPGSWVLRKLAEFDALWLYGRYNYIIVYYRYNLYRVCIYIYTYHITIYLYSMHVVNITN